MKISRANIATSIGGVLGVAFASLLYPQDARLAVIIGAFVGAIIASLAFSDEEYL